MHIAIAGNIGSGKSNLEYEGQKSDKTIVGTYQYGRTFLLGVRYKL